LEVDHVPLLLFFLWLPFFKKKEVTDKIEDVEMQKRKVAKSQQKMDDAKKDFDRHSEAIAAGENEIEELGDINHLLERKEEFESQMNANKERLRQFRVRTAFSIISLPPDFDSSFCSSRS
jgi:seryl-tRNA synthetase